MALSRREFILATGATISSVALKKEAEAVAAIPTRNLGKTGWKTTIFAIGTAEIPVTGETVRLLNKLIDAGVNYIDTAPSYQGTRSETAVGMVMAKRRKQVFLATKTLARDADGAIKEVRQSLARLQTKTIDVVQLHAINDDATLDKVLAKGGAVEGLERAKKEGLIRHIGITGHTRPEVILKAMKNYPFASILVPVSPLDIQIGDFTEETIPYANKHGVAVVGMKALKGMEKVLEMKLDAAPLLRYAWSLPISTLIVGLRREEHVTENLQLVRNFKKMTSKEMQSLEASLKPNATVANLWWKQK